MGPFGLLYGEDTSWPFRVMIVLFAVGMLFGVGYFLYLMFTDPRIHGNGNKNAVMNGSNTTSNVTIMPWSGVYN